MTATTAAKKTATERIDENAKRVQLRELEINAMALCALMLARALAFGRRGKGDPETVTSMARVLEASTTWIRVMRGES